jgi:hypothetical protein
MRKWALAMVWMAASGACYGAQEQITAQSAGKIRVCVNSSTYAPTLVLARAEAITSRMFATAGVTVEWHSAAPAVCQGAQPTRTVVLDFATNTPPGEHPGAMAYAHPYEAVHIVVLYDRIEKSADGPIQASTFLAHVMTHEITHLLQGISRHSQTGVMKAHWDAHDFAQMAYKPLPFAPEDIDLIQLGLRRLAAGAGSGVSPATTKYAQDGDRLGELRRQAVPIPVEEAGRSLPPDPGSDEGKAGTEPTGTADPVVHWRSDSAARPR